MGPRPWRPVRELENALERGWLTLALMAAHDLCEDGGKVSLRLGLEFLPLIIAERMPDYPRWALRWLARYALERAQTVEDAAEVACLLEELPGEPKLIARLRGRFG